MFGDQTLISATASRLSHRIPKESWLVVTNEEYTSLVKESLTFLGDDRIVGEPVAKNTAPCIALATAMAAKENPESVVITLPSDHYITDVESFRSVMDSAIRTASEQDALVTIGIRPDKPETGYGYIQCRPHGEVADQKGHAEFMDVVRFREKPDLETAKAFLADGNYLWNSGMFIWRASVFLEELRLRMPELHSAVTPFIDTAASKEEIDRFFHQSTSISIDYGLMEKAEQVKVVPGDFGWNDVGSWEAIHALAKPDADRNTGDTSQSVFLGSHGNHIHQKNGSKVTAVIGVEGLAIIDTEDALLVCPLDRAQDVKKVVDRLGADQALKRFT